MLSRDHSNEQLRFTYIHSPLVSNVLRSVLLTIALVLHNAYSLIFLIPVLLINNKRSSIDLIKHIGIKVSSTSLISKTSQFIPMREVKDIVINEGFKGLQCVFYLVLILQDKLVLVLPDADLPLEELIQIRKEIHEMLHQKETPGDGVVPLTPKDEIT